ncbi:MAG: hypothetical protein JWM81_307 [Candidatus Saccharibacteria bacterium]|nr:hypothetical protein [Candidatus Saccharibacteria bacterium]
MRIEQDLPTLERVQATYNGLTYNEFKVLSDEAVDAIWDTHRANDYSWLQMESEDEDSAQPVDETPAPSKKGDTLQDFTTWRRFGIPDQEVSRQDIEDYAIDAADARRAKNPEWGIIPGSHFEGWTKSSYTCVNAILNYCYRMRGLTQQPAIDTYSLYDTIGLSRKEIDTMIEKGVLNPMGDEASYIGPDDNIYHNYYLGGIYFDNFFAVITNWAKHHREEAANKQLS